MLTTLVALIACLRVVIALIHGLSNMHHEFLYRSLILKLENWALLD